MRAAVAVRITAAGLNARVSQPVAELLASGPTGAVDAHAVQPYYTRLLADACGISISLVAEGDKVVATAR